MRYLAVLSLQDRTCVESCLRRSNRQELCLGVSDLPFRKETFDQYSELAKSVGYTLRCWFLVLSACFDQIFKMSTGMVSIIGEDVFMTPDQVRIW